MITSIKSTKWIGSLVINEFIYNQLVSILSQSIKTGKFTVTNKDLQNMSSQMRSFLQTILCFAEAVKSIEITQSQGKKQKYDQVTKALSYVISNLLISITEGRQLDIQLLRWCTTKIYLTQEVRQQCLSLANCLQKKNQLDNQTNKRRIQNFCKNQYNPTTNSFRNSTPITYQQLKDPSIERSESAEDNALLGFLQKLSFFNPSQLNLSLLASSFSSLSASVKQKIYNIYRFAFDLQKYSQIMLQIRPGLTQAKQLQRISIEASKLQQSEYKTFLVSILSNLKDVYYDKNQTGLCSVEELSGATAKSQNLMRKLQYIKLYLAKLSEMNITQWQLQDLRKQSNQLTGNITNDKEVSSEIARLLYSIAEQKRSLLQRENNHQQNIGEQQFMRAFNLQQINASTYNFLCDIYNQLPIQSKSKFKQWINGYFNLMVLKSIISKIYASDFKEQDLMQQIKGMQEGSIKQWAIKLQTISKKFADEITILKTNYFQLYQPFKQVKKTSESQLESLKGQFKEDMSIIKQFFSYLNSQQSFQSLKILENNICDFKNEKRNTCFDEIADQLSKICQRKQFQLTQKTYQNQKMQRQIDDIRNRNSVLIDEKYKLQTQKIQLIQMISSKDLQLHTIANQKAELQLQNNQSKRLRQQISKASKLQHSTVPLKDNESQINNLRLSLQQQRKNYDYLLRQKIILDRRIRKQQFTYYCKHSQYSVNNINCNGVKEYQTQGLTRNKSQSQERDEKIRYLQSKLQVSQNLIKEQTKKHTTELVELRINRRRLIKALNPEINNTEQSLQQIAIQAEIIELKRKYDCLRLQKKMNISNQNILDETNMQIKRKQFGGQHVIQDTLEPESTQTIYRRLLTNWRQTETQLQEKRQQLQRIQASVKNKSDLLQSLGISITKIEEDKRKIGDNLKQLQEQRNNIETNINTLKQQQAECQNNLGTKKIKQDEIAFTVKNLKTEWKELDTKIKQKQPYLNELDQLTKDLNNQLLKIASQMKPKQEKYNNLNKQMKQKLSQKTNLLSELSSLKQQQTTKKAQLTKLQAQISKLQSTQVEKLRKLDEINSQLEKKRQTLSKLEKEIKTIERQATKPKEDTYAMESVKNLNKELQQKQVKLRELDNQIISAEKQCTKLAKKKQTLQIQYESIQREIQFHTTKLKELRQEAKNNITYLNALLIGDCIPDEELREKQLLIDQIEKQSGKIVKKTRALYYFDERNNTSFHEYVDHKQNLLLLVRTGLGYLIGGFGQGMLVSGKDNYEQGFIFSFSNGSMKVFPMMKDGKKKIMKYDPYYIIFGNAEIRIRNNEKKVFSNFGLANGVFENYGNGLQELIGISPADKQAEITNYEVHQVFFR